MNLRPDTYVPSLRWRCGEYQALFRLGDSAKDRIVPFVVVPEIEFDFEEWRPKKTVQAHVTPFARRYHQKWGNRPAWIDAHPKVCSLLMDNGKLPILHVFDELRVMGSAAIPVASLDASKDIVAAVAAIFKDDGRGIGAHARLEHIMEPRFGALLAALMKTIGAGEDETDLIVDLGAPNYEPYEDFADGLIAAIDNIGDVSGYRSFVLLVVRSKQMVPILLSSSPPRKRGPRASDGAVAPCSCQGQALDSRFRGNDEKGGYQMSNSHH
jgi:hypothetical protein